MRTWALAGVVLGIGLGGSVVLAGDDEPPPLRPAAVSAPVVASESELEAPALLPELRRPVALAPGPLPDLVPPPLTGPAEMERAAPVPTPAAHVSRPRPGASMPARPGPPAPPPRRDRIWNRLTPAVA